MYPLMKANETRALLNAGGEAFDAEGFRELMRSYERNLNPETYGRVRQRMSTRGLADSKVSQ